MINKLRRDAGPISLLLASVGGMVGSGWLFGALNAAKIAGPAAIISWVIGGFAVLLLALVYAELSTMFPRPGAVVIFPQLCFGNLAARVMSWVNFLAYVVVAPVEALSVVSYASNFWPWLEHTDTGELTKAGLIAAIGLMLLFLLINLCAIRLVLALNNAITWWKLVIPAVTVIMLVSVHFRPGNFTEAGFAPTGAAGIFSAVSGSGILFAFLGFRQAIELAGESRNPRRNLPLAIAGSVLLCMVLYEGLQIAFIGALSPDSLMQGWEHLKFPGISGPFAGLATALGLPWLAAALYTDAAISPSGTGIIYNTTAARVIYATSEAGFLPSRLAGVSRTGVPLGSLGLSFFAGLFFLLPLPSWKELVTYVSSIGVLAYGTGPVVLTCFRRTLPEQQFPRPFRLGFARIIAPAAFIVGNLVVFWAGAKVVNHLFGGLLIAFLAYLVWTLATQKPPTRQEWRGAMWMGPYFTGLWLITYLGPIHGLGILNNVGGAIAVALLSIVVLILAQISALPDPQAAKTRLGQVEN